MSGTAGVYKNGGRRLSDKEIIKSKAANKQNHATSGKFGFFFLDYNPGQARKKSETVLMTSNQVLGQVFSLHLIGHGKS